MFSVFSLFACVEKTSRPATETTVEVSIAGIANEDFGIDGTLYLPECASKESSPRFERAHGSGPQSRFGTSARELVPPRTAPITGPMHASMGASPKNFSTGQRHYGKYPCTINWASNPSMCP